MDLEELERFSKHFKRRRVELGTFKFRFTDISCCHYCFLLFLCMIEYFVKCMCVMRV